MPHTTRRKCPMRGRLLCSLHPVCVAWQPNRRVALLCPNECGTSMLRLSDTMVSYLPTWTAGCHAGAVLPAVLLAPCTKKTTGWPRARTLHSLPFPGPHTDTHALHAAGHILQASCFRQQPQPYTGTPPLHHAPGLQTPRTCGAWPLPFGSTAGGELADTNICQCVLLGLVFALFCADKAARSTSTQQLGFPLKRRSK